MNSERYALVLDLDGVLIDKEIIKAALRSYCLGLGFSREEYNESYKDAKSKGFYDHRHHAETLLHLNDVVTEDKQLTAEVLAGNFLHILAEKSYVFPGVRDFLVSVSVNTPQIDLFISSRGEQDWQISKLGLSRLAQFFKGISIIQTESKSEFVLELIQQDYSRIIFVDDQFAEIKSVADLVPDVAEQGVQILPLWVAHSYIDKSEYAKGVDIAKWMGEKNFLEIRNIEEVRLLLPSIFRWFREKERRNSKIHKYGPFRLVSIGGGTGLPNLLSGVKYNGWWETIDAVVVMSDSGGESGKLRREHHVLPPSDIARAMLALSPREEAFKEFFFNREISDFTALHAIISGLESLKNFEEALHYASVYLRLPENHRALPITLDDSHLCAEMVSGVLANNEVSVDELMCAGEIIKNLSLQPEASCNPRVIDAITKADIITIGPGSFFTSILPNFLVSGIREVIAQSHARIIFIMNLFTEGRGMADLNARDIVDQLEEYVGSEISRIIVNEISFPDEQLSRYAEEFKYPIQYDLTDPRIIPVPMKTHDDNGRPRHDSRQLAQVVYDLSKSLMNE